MTSIERTGPDSAIVPFCRRFLAVQAEIRDRAARAQRAPRLADIAAMQDQPVVRILAEFIRHGFHQPVLHCAHRAAGREPGAIRDAEDMRVHRDGRLAECGVEHDIRRLAPDAGQRFQGGTLARNLAAVALEEHARRGDHVLRLHAPEADGADVAGEPALAKREHPGGRTGDAEQRAGREVDAAIGRLSRQDDRHQKLVGRLPGELGRGPRVGCAQPFEQPAARGGAEDTLRLAPCHRRPGSHAG